MSNQAINSFDTYRKFRVPCLTINFKIISKESRKEQKIKTLANIKQDELQFIDATKTSNFCTVQKVMTDSWNICNEHVL